MIPDELIRLVILGVGAAAGYFLKDYLDRRKEAEARRISDRREHYQNLILCLKSLSEGHRDNDKLLRFEYSFLWLCAPDPVIQSLNKLLRRMRLEGGSTNIASEIGELALAMRRDVGFMRTRLTASEFEPNAE